MRESVGLRRVAVRWQTHPIEAIRISHAAAGGHFAPELHEY